MSERIISNTGPLIGLAIIDQLDLLKTLYYEVIIPEVVHQELLQGGDNCPGVTEYRQATWIMRQPLINPLEPSLEATLDAGEASVIQLARECGIPNVLLDERKGRKIARIIYGLHVIGTAGLLVKAKHQGLITNVREALLGMRAEGYHIHEDIVEFTLRKAGEI